MSIKTLPLNDELHQYMLSVSLREPSVAGALRAENASRSNRNMQIAPEQGQFIALLVQLIQARRALEIGVFTGYSSLWIARALPPDGRLIACDTNEEYANAARRHWVQAGVAERIDLRLAPAQETLRQLQREDAGESFDFIFIDAEKTEYQEYYELSLPLLRPGGLIAIDNVLWAGRVCDAAVQDANTEAIRVFNRKLHGDERVSLSLVPIGDGLSLAMKR